MEEFNQNELIKLKQTELIARCKEKKLPYTGTKKQMVERLFQNYLVERELVLEESNEEDRPVSSSSSNEQREMFLE